VTSEHGEIGEVQLNGGVRLPRGPRCAGGGRGRYSDTIRDRDSIEVRNICGPAELYGHAGVHGAFSDFCDRWSAGVDQLVEDASIISESLTAVAQNYRSVDEASRSALDPDLLPP